MREAASTASTVPSAMSVATSARTSSYATKMPQIHIAREKARFSNAIRDGSDGTRTRDLRRDRPAPPTTTVDNERRRTHAAKRLSDSPTEYDRLAA